MAANRFFHIFFLLISLNFMYWIDIVKLYNELSWAVYANSEFILREICEWLQMLMAFTRACLSFEGFTLELLLYYNMVINN